MSNCFFNNNKLPLDLKNTSLPKIPKAAVVSSAMKAKDYPELAVFKQHIEQKGGGQAKLYTRRKTQVFAYKSIFFGFSALFVFLGFLSVTIPSALGCGWVGSCFMLKSVLMFFCFSLSASAFTVGYKMCGAKEAIMHQVKKSLNYAAKIYAYKKARMGPQRFFFFFGAEQKQMSALKQMYQEVCDKIQDKKEETKHLISRISGSPIEANKQEHLYNQAIEELRDKLHQLNQTFRNAAPPHYT